VEKFQGNPCFSSHSVEPPTSVKQCRWNRKIQGILSRKSEKLKILDLNFFPVTRISNLRNFDMTSMAVCNVDGESLREIAIHNFEKSKKS